MDKTPCANKEKSIYPHLLMIVIYKKKKTWVVAPLDNVQVATWENTEMSVTLK